MSEKDNLPNADEKQKAIPENEQPVKDKKKSKTKPSTSKSESKLAEQLDNKEPTIENTSAVPTEKKAPELTAEAKSPEVSPEKELSKQPDPKEDKQIQDPENAEASNTQEAVKEASKENPLQVPTEKKAPELTAEAKTPEVSLEEELTKEPNAKEDKEIQDPENTETSISVEAAKEAIKENTPNAPAEETPEATPEAKTHEVSPEEELSKEPDSKEDKQIQDPENNEASNTEEAEKSEAPQESKLDIPTTQDFNSMSLDQLVDELEQLVSADNILSVRNKVETIKSEFSTKFATILEEVKSKFLEDGGDSIDFKFNFPLKTKFNALYKTYRERKKAYFKNLEKSYKENLEIRLEIIEEIKNLLSVEENINDTYKHFKALQERWKNSGPIARDKYNNVWNNYHHHVENFYDFLHLNRDLRDLDFKHNLEQKQKIVARAEELAQDNNVNRAFRELQDLHKIWKEELGPVPKEHREEIWEKFSAATKIIHQKRQEHFSKLDEVYEENLVKKNEIIAQIAALAEDDTNTHSAWQQKIKKIEDLRKQFFNAGKVPLKVNEATWAKFKETVRLFNRKKNAFYKNLKKEQYENLKKKLELIKIAEENKDSDDFEVTTLLMKKIQSDWKNIGHVPKKDSDKIWKKFKAACNFYFDRLHAEKNQANKEEVEALEKKTELLEKVKQLQLKEGDLEDNLRLIKEQTETWKAIGRVPYNSRFIDKKFNKIIDALYSQLNLNKADKELIKYENKLEVMSNASDNRALNNEHNFIRKKISEIESEINQLENNLLFFSNVDDKNPVVKDVHKNIDGHKKELSLWKLKLRKIKKLD